MSFLDDVFVNAAAAVDAMGKAANEMVDKSKVFISTAELRNKISASFETLGRYVYDTHAANNTDPAVVTQYANEISELISELKNLQDNIVASSGKKVCPVCGCSNSNDSLFCKKCGTSLDFTHTYTVKPKPSENVVSEAASKTDEESAPVEQPVPEVTEEPVSEVGDDSKDTAE